MRLYIFKSFLWLIGNQARSSAINNPWKLRDKWSGTAVSDVHEPTRFILRAFFRSIESPSHEWLLYKLTHTCKAHFWVPFVTPVGIILSKSLKQSTWFTSWSFHCLFPFLCNSFPPSKSAFTPLCPLILCSAGSHPLIISIFCLSLTLSLSYREHFGFVWQEPPNKIFHIFMQRRHSTPLFPSLRLTLFPPLYLPSIFTHLGCKERPGVPLNRQFVPEKPGQASMPLFRQADLFSYFW